LRSPFTYNPGPFNKSWGFNVGPRASRRTILSRTACDAVLHRRVYDRAKTQLRIGDAAVHCDVEVVHFRE
jgi:hypothetical protein